MNEKPKLGMKQKILQAATITEIASLLARVRNFTEAHPSTIRKCERAAQRRTQELEAK